MAEGKKSWYDTGYEAHDREKQRLATSGGPSRFWMKAGTSREIIFLDDEPFVIDEHNWYANGNWFNYCTCLKDAHDSSPCCDKLGVKSRYWVGFYTIVDCTANTDSKGNTHQYEVKLLPAKYNSVPVIKRKKESRGGSLIGQMFKVTRDNADQPNIGNDFEWVKEVNLDQLLKVATYKGKKLLDLYKEAGEKPDVMTRLKHNFQLATEPSGLIVPKMVPLNYISLLAPKEPKEIRQMLSGYIPQEDDKSSGGGGSVGGGAKNDDIPF